MPFGKRQGGHSGSGISRPPVPVRSYSAGAAAAPAATRPGMESSRRSGRPAGGMMALLAPERALEVADDLAHFFGRNADVYLATYTKMVERQHLVVIGWHWPLFFTYTIWVFYRRQWIAGLGLTALPFLLQLLGNGAVPAFLGVLLSLSVIMKALYVNEGLKRIVEADAMGLTGPQRMTWLMRRGGVSMSAAILVIVLHVAAGAVAATSAVTEFLAQQQAAQDGMDAGAPAAPIQRAPRTAEESIPR